MSGKEVPVVDDDPADLWGRWEGEREEELEEAREDEEAVRRFLDIDEPRLLAGTQAVGYLIGRLSSRDPRTRQLAALALGKAGDRAAVWPLIDQLEREPARAERAASALGVLRDERAVWPLIRASGRSERRIWENTAYAITDKPLAALTCQ